MVGAPVLDLTRDPREQTALIEAALWPLGQFQGMIKRHKMRNASSVALFVRLHGGADLSIGAGKQPVAVMGKGYRGKGAAQLDLCARASEVTGHRQRGADTSSSECRFRATPSHPRKTKRVPLP